MNCSKCFSVDGEIHSDKAEECWVKHPYSHFLCFNCGKVSKIKEVSEK